MPRKYDESDILVIKDDRSRVRKRPTIFVPSLDKQGAMHIIFEIIDNSIDELTTKDSVGHHLSVSFDTVTKECVVEDDGAGIPLGKLLDVCTVLNSSGKMDTTDETAYGATGGVNGYGNKLMCFLSKSATITSSQKGKYLRYKFKDGLLKDTEKGSTKKHGVKTEFVIDQKIIDINSVTKSDIKERLEEKAYVYPDLDIVLTFLKDGKEDSVKQYSGKNIVDRVTKWSPDTQILRVTDTRNITLLERITDDKLTANDVGVDLAFAFKEDVLDADDPNTYIVAYGNTIKNYRGGTHVEGLRDGLVKFFRDRLNSKRKENEPVIMPSDCYAGLCAFVTVSIKNPLFRGQYKDELQNQSAKFAVRDAVCEALENAPKGMIKEFEEFIKRVAHGRAASKKIRRKDVANSFSKDRINKYYKINRTNKTFDPELVLVEGDSAAGNAVSVRDPYNQAIFSIQKPKNLYDTKSEYANTLKTAFNSILDICGVMAGAKCDPSKSSMRRILCLTDGDVDGDSIAISAICLLAKHCKPLVDAGMVGRILPPAYRLIRKGKKPVFVHTQREFFDEITKYFIKDVKIGYKGKEMSESELNQFVLNNFYYVDKLKKLADRYHCDYKFMEMIAWMYHGELEDQKQSYWMKVLKAYPDIKVIKEKADDDDKSKTHLVITGTIRSKDMSTGGYDFVDVPFDDYWQKRVNVFKEYQNHNTDIYHYSINGEKDKSVLDVMQLFNDYIPDDVTRYKGLGELNSSDLLKLCMDRKKREVYIFKFNDLKEDLHKIDIIMSTKKEFLEARAKVLMNESIDDLDLDT